MELKNFYILPDPKNLNAYGYIEIIYLIILGIIALVSCFIHMLGSLFIVTTIYCVIAILGDIAIIVGIVFAFLGICYKLPIRIKYSFYIMIGALTDAIIMIIWLATYKFLNEMKLIEIILLPCLMFVLYKQGANESTNISQPIVEQSEENQNQSPSGEPNQKNN